jgi:hypothetical protein
LTFIVVKSSGGYHRVITTHELKLAIFTEKFVARFALKGFVRELTADDTLNFLDHLSLEFVLNFIHLNIKGWNWLRSHNLLNGLVSNNQVESLVVTKILFLSVHFLENRSVLSLVLVHVLYWHL